MQTDDTLLLSYNYSIDESLIAHTPADPKENARLLVYDAKSNEVTHRHICDLPQLLAGCHLVFNDTKVLPARVRGFTSSGHEVELLCLVDQGFSAKGEWRALVNRYLPVGAQLYLGEIVATVVENHEKSLVFTANVHNEEWLSYIEKFGETPLPPYIKTTLLESERRISYQTVFANQAPSVAAPTASLHFTTKLLEELPVWDITSSRITLQVGLGTFAPIFADNFQNKKLHSEYYSISSQSASDINLARSAERPVVAVGTTVVRALESAKDILQNGLGCDATTDIFIYHPYQFTYPDILLTNFHVPRSSLMCLVDAFIKDKQGKKELLELYEIAIKEKYRFYSFGDAMLVV